MSDQEGAERLLSAVNQLWPGHRAVLRSGSARPRELDGLVFVPRQRGARLLVRTGSRRAAAQAMLRFSRALPLRDRTSRLVGSAALRWGGTGWLPDAIELAPLDNGRSSVEDHLSAALGFPASVGLGVGRLRPNQKPVLQVFDDRGALRAYAKVGHSSFTSLLVNREAAALAELGRHRWRVLQPPELLHHGRWEGLEVLVTAAIATPAWPGLGRTQQPPVAALDEFYDAFDEGVQEVRETPYWSRLRTPPPHLEGSPEGRGYEEAVERLHARLGRARLPMSAWHGDFAPWNMASRGGRLQVWDWEQFAQGVPRGLDRCHYRVQRATRARGFRSSVVLDALAEPSSPARNGEALLPELYLASLAHRYLSATALEGGGVLQPSAVAVLESLSTLTRTPGRIT